MKKTSSISPVSLCHNRSTTWAAHLPPHRWDWQWSATLNLNCLACSSVLQEVLSTFSLNALDTQTLLGVERLEVKLMVGCSRIVCKGWLVFLSLWRIEQQDWTGLTAPLGQTADKQELQHTSTTNSTTIIVYYIAIIRVYLKCTQPTGTKFPTGKIIHLGKKVCCIRLKSLWKYNCAIFFNYPWTLSWAGIQS